MFSDRTQLFPTWFQVEKSYTAQWFSSSGLFRLASLKEKMKFIKQSTQKNHRESLCKTGNNHNKANFDKCNLLAISNYEASANTYKFEIESSKEEKLPGISVDTRFSFQEHITSLCKKASQKLHVLTRMVHTLYWLRKRKTINETTCISHFSFCSFIWMFHIRALNNGGYTSKHWSEDESIF